jgi:hypothetical protein
LPAALGLSWRKRADAGRAGVFLGQEDGWGAVFLAGKEFFRAFAGRAYPDSPTASAQFGTRSAIARNI